MDVMFGLPPDVPPRPVHQYSKDLRARLDTAYERLQEQLGWWQRRQKMVYDRRQTGRPYGIGEWVWLYYFSIVFIHFYADGGVHGRTVLVGDSGEEANGRVQGRTVVARDIDSGDEADGEHLLM